jgi:hypothetical protein
MLSKKTFNSGLEKLAIEYKGFEMEKDRTKQWYGYLKDFDDEYFLNGIDECIHTCNRVPYMSDVYKAIVNAKNEGEKEKERNNPIRIVERDYL